MSATSFWPRAGKYDVHVLQLELPETLSNAARALINETLVLTDILRANQNTEHRWRSQITALATQRLKTAFLSLSTHLLTRTLNWHSNGGRKRSTIKMKRKSCVRK